MVPLIIGSLPEPNNIGGVVIFVSRLLKSSNYLEVNDYLFYSTKNRNIFSLIPLIYRSKFVHFNGSNPMAMFFISVICFLFDKKLILSIHAQVGISNWLLNLLEKYSIKLAHRPVVGIGSISNASKMNKNTIVIPSFIEPEVFPDPIVDEIISLNDGKAIFCTNANRYAFDNNNDEIYGISYLVNYFEQAEDSLLIVADTSGTYFEKYNKVNPPNVVFINKDINFSYLLQESDCFIRFTSTDGDSVSIMESLFLKVPVIASDCITRHKSCILCQFGNLQSLAVAIDRFKKGDFEITEVESAVSHYDNLYQELSLL